MRKIALLAAVAGVVAVGSMAHADFVYSILPITQISGTGTPLDGDDVVTLMIQQTGTGTAQVGNVSNYSGVTLTSTSANPQFFIRTFDLNGSNSAGNGPAYNSTSASNVNPDLGNQAITELDGVTSRPGPSGSYVRLGTNSASDMAKFSLLASTPSESQGTFSDYQALATFSVDGGEPAPTGFNVNTAKTLAVAVVPHGQEVTFSGTVFATSLGSVPSVFSLSVPEPTSLALAGIGAAGLLARRRRA